ncbi:MAG: sulfatase, partial [Verrucomicrobiae bacterium]|nr:sulfatase [Verrucomicrobiae bacterium]
SSMVGLLTGREEERPRPFFWHFPHYNNQGGQPSGAARLGDWMLIEFYENNRAELYHLGLDAGEKTDLAAKEPDRVKDLRALLARFRESAGVQTNTPNPDFDPALHKLLYEDLDVSLYNASTADAAALNRILEWRKQMDAVLPAPKSPPKSVKKRKSK